MINYFHEWHSNIVRSWQEAESWLGAGAEVHHVHVIQVDRVGHGEVIQVENIQALAGWVIDSLVRKTLK